MARAADKELKLSSHLWAALGYLAKKRTDRELITEGSSTVIDVAITGKVGRSSITQVIAGKLQLGKSSMRASSEAAPTNQVVALCLQALPDDQARAKFIERTIQAKEKAGVLPAVPEPLIKTVEAFLTRLRSSSESKKAGDLRFDLDTP